MYNDRSGLPAGRFPVHSEPVGNEREGEGANEVHLMDGAAPIGKAFTQDVAKIGKLLAFCLLAARIAASIRATLDLGRSSVRARSAKGSGQGVSSATLGSLAPW